MRSRALAFACTVTFVAAGALTALAAPVGAQEEEDLGIAAADRGSKTSRFLFFPVGHGTLKSVPHPATDLPHLDVYSGTGKKFTDAQSVAYADGTSVTTGATCTPTTPSGSGSASVKTTSQAKQLVCKFTANPVFIAIPASTVELPNLAAVVGDQLVVHAQMGSAADVASTLDYDGKACKLTKLPK